MVFLSTLEIGITIVVHRGNGILLTKCPPPTECKFATIIEGRPIAILHVHNVGEDIAQWFTRTAIIWRHREITAKFQHRILIVRIETGFLQHIHSIRFAENVVVESALRYVVPQRSLGEA